MKYKKITIWKKYEKNLKFKNSPENSWQTTEENINNFILWESQHMWTSQKTKFG
jgi:hypothetical protein